MQETQVQSLGQEESLEKGSGNPLQYSGLENHGQRILVGHIGSQRVKHNQVT